ncbi:chondroitin sulfate proteoglycan 5 isoform X2 [Protopterus annectens]|uniref:chondroitin sulfate proteoglycan 5 isoform X2 n=1 Tax=Protopterus annectens TaxID=7888 RepID=UPI001CFB4A1C|nr:chondroitin sulfate proteoglycan 5 isoform X2 [Protopterus annectens]
MGKRHIFGNCFGCWCLVLLSFTQILPLSFSAAYGSNWKIYVASTTDTSVWDEEGKTTSLDVSLHPLVPIAEDHVTDHSLMSRSPPLVPVREAASVSYTDQGFQTQTSVTSTTHAAKDWDSDKPDEKAFHLKPTVHLTGVAENWNADASVTSEDESDSSSAVKDTLRSNDTQNGDENDKSSPCLGCGAADDEIISQSGATMFENLKEKDVRASKTMTSSAWTANEEAHFVSLQAKKASPFGPVVATWSQDDTGSGDQHARVSVSTDPLPDLFGKEQILTALQESTSPTPSQTSPTTSKFNKEPPTTVLSPDSAEKDHLLEVLGNDPTQTFRAFDGTGKAQTLHPTAVVDVTLEFAGGDHGLDLWEDKLTKPPAQGAHGITDFTLLDLDLHLKADPATTSSFEPLTTPEPTSDQIPLDILTGEYYYENYDPYGRHIPNRFHDTPESWSDSDAATWPLPEIYEDFTSYDEPYLNPTTSINERNYGESFTNPEYENTDRSNTSPSTMDKDPINKHSSILEKYRPDLVTNDDLELKLRPEINKDSSQMGTGFISDNSTECKHGYIRRNNTCRSVCDAFPLYCYNGGQCYLVEDVGVFCRCNTQDYIWHKGVRCESIVTDFQVMCIAIGSAALVLLLLFMMTVFFAKKLYLLKTENTKLRKRRYRTPSEQHNDNFSLSTIAEGSHPNVRKLCDTPSNLFPHVPAMAYYDNLMCQDDPNAPSKIQEPAKSPQKEEDEDSFNIQNSLTPKLENNKAEENLEVNSLQNNLT